MGTGFHVLKLTHVPVALPSPSSPIPESMDSQAIQNWSSPLCFSAQVQGPWGGELCIWSQGP